MNRTQQRQNFVRWAALCAAIGLCEPRSLATIYTFDLTDQTDGAFGGALESPVDLGVTFSHIDSASIELSGTFTPGLKTFFTIPPNALPPVTHDDLLLGLRLGDENTTWIEKPTFAFQDFKGLSGQIDVVLPLSAVEPSPTLPVLFPGGGGAPEFGFLLDGRFALSTSGVDILQGNYVELVLPTFSTGKISLIVEGNVVPEPATFSIAVAMLGGAVFRRRRRKYQGDDLLSY